MNIKINFKDVNDVETLNYKNITVEVTCGSEDGKVEPLELLQVNDDVVDLKDVETITNVRDYICVLLQKLELEKSKINKNLAKEVNETPNSFMDLIKTLNKLYDEVIEGELNIINNKIKVFSIALNNINSHLENLTIEKEVEENNTNLEEVVEEDDKTKAQAKFWAEKFMEQLEDVDKLPEAHRNVLTKLLSDYGVWLLNK